MAKARSTKQPTKERVVAAALELAAAKGWARVSMQDIASACDCDLSMLHELFEERGDILAAYGRMVDSAVMDRIGPNGQDAGTERDRLFDVMMERFDVLNENRDAVKSIAASFCGDPKQAVIGLPHLGRSMVWMLEAACIDANGPRGAIRAVGLMGVYLYALKAWVNDDSPDMAKTMAALDRGLGHAERLADILPG